MKSWLLVLPLAVTLQAQEGFSWVAGRAGLNTYAQSTPTFRNALATGLEIGTWALKDKVGLTLSMIHASPACADCPNLKLDENHLMGTVLWNLNPGGESVYPYLGIGGGLTQAATVKSLVPRVDETVMKPQVHMALGVLGRFGKHWVAGVDVRAIKVRMDQPRSELLTTLGLGVRWGEPEPLQVATARVAWPPPVTPLSAALPPSMEAEPAQPAPPPPPRKPVVAQKIVLDAATLHFANNRAELGPEGVEAIKEVAESLKQFTGRYGLVVTGHTSSRGGRALNQRLSLERARAVARVLVASGIPATQIQCKGLGPDQPIADNKTLEGEAKNRRVEIDVKPEGAPVEVRQRKTSTVDPTGAFMQRKRPTGTVKR